MRVVFYHVGKGDLSLVLLPNGEAMLVDCYKANEAAAGMTSDTDSALDRIQQRVIEHKLALADINSEDGESLLNEAIREKEGKQKVRIWILAITHGDRDHILSKKRLLDKFDIQFLMDNGREYVNPSESLKDYLNFRTEMANEERYRPIRKSMDDIIPQSGARVDVLCPNRIIASDENPNSQCLVLRFEYKNRTFLFAGDSELDDWTNPEYGILSLHKDKVSVDVLNVSHHGSRTFFTPSGSREPSQPDYSKSDFETQALISIAPQISFITCSNDEDANHPHPIALQVYQELTNPMLESSEQASHVYLSRETQNMHFIVDEDGELYARTSRSRCDRSCDGALSSGPYLSGRVSSQNGYLHASGIWVVTSGCSENISFSLTKKGVWPNTITFDWRVLNNGHGEDALHHEFYGMPSRDGKKSTSWSRPLRYEGVHLMQCHARTDDNEAWANWCCLVCFQGSLRYALRWIELFPTCIDSRLISS